MLHCYNFFTVNRKIILTKAALTGVFLSLFLQFAEISFVAFGGCFGFWFLFVGGGGFCGVFWLACVLEVVGIFLFLWGLLFCFVCFLLTPRMT